MNTLKKLKNNYLFLSLAFAFLNLLLVYLFFGWQKDDDTLTLIETIEGLVNKNFDKLFIHRILRPLGPLFSIPLLAIFSPFHALIFQNVIFYFLSAFFLFKIAKEIFKDEKSGLLSVIFYLTAYPLLRNGPAALTDMGAWFFYLSSLYLTLLFLKKPKDSLVYLNGFISGFGVLMKENAGFGILFFFSLLIFSKKFQRKEILKRGFQFLIFFIIPILINQLIVYHYFKYTYWDWYRENKKYLKESYNIFNLTKSFFVTFGFHWFFVFAGALKILKERDEEKIFILKSMLIPSLSFFLWPSVISRLMYIAGPFLSLLASQSVKNKKHYYFLIFSIIFNFFLVKLSYIIRG